MLHEWRIRICIPMAVRAAPNHHACNYKYSPTMWRTIFSRHLVQTRLIVETVRINPQPLDVLKFARVLSQLAACVIFNITPVYTFFVSLFVWRSILKNMMLIRWPMKATIWILTILCAQCHTRGGWEGLVVET